MHLGDVAQVRAGFPFRGRLPLADAGDARVIQMRDLLPAGSVAWDGVARVQLAGRLGVHRLRDADVLFIARGAGIQASCLQNVPARTVCSPHFFVLRCTHPQLLPAFLAWQINRAPAQAYLRRHAEGSLQLAVRRGVLEALPILLPPLARQQLLLDFAAGVEQERQHFEALIRNRQAQLDALALGLHDAAPPAVETA